MTKSSQPTQLDALVQAVGGDRKAALEAIRDRLAAELTRARGTGAAAIARELREVLTELEAIPDPEVSPVEQLLRRRAERRAAAESGAVDSVRKQRGTRSGGTGSQRGAAP